MADVPVTRQTDRAVDLVIAAQAAKGTLPDRDSPGGFRLPFNAYNGVEFQDGRTPDARNSKDGMTDASQQGRQGFRLSGAQLPLMVGGGYDLLWQGVQRNAYQAEVITTQTEMGGQLQSMSANGLATFAGDPLARGVKFGHVHVWTSGLDAADLNKPHFVVGVTSTTIQYANSFTAVALATDFSLTAKRYVGNGAQRWPLAIEDRSDNRDQSDMLDFALIERVALAASGTGAATLTLDFNALDYQDLSTTNSPYFTTVTEVSGEPITAPRLQLNIGGTWVPYESLNLNWETGFFTDNTNSIKPVDGAQGSTVLSGNFQILDDALAKQTFDINRADSWEYVALEGIDPTGKFWGVAFPRVKIISPAKSQKGENRFSTRTFQMEISKDRRGGAFSTTMGVVSSDT